MIAPGTRKRAADFKRMHDRFCDWSTSEVVSCPEGERGPVSFMIVDKKTRRAVFIFTPDTLMSDRIYRSKLESEKCFKVLEFNVQPKWLLQFINSVSSLVDLERVVDNFIPILKKAEPTRVLSDCQIN